MSLVRLISFRSIQPILTRSATTSAKNEAKPTANAPKNEKPSGDAIDENDDQVNAELATGRERSLNRVQLIGRVGADPKVGGTQRHKVVTFNLATNEYSGTNSESGEVKQRVDWHRIAVFQPRLLDNAEKYIRQGDRLYVQGRLHHNLIQDKKSGQQRYVASIIADDLIFLTKR